jgi:hypothetical protein
LGSTGCSSNNSKPTSSDYDNVAQTTAAIVSTSGGSGGGEIGSMADVATISVGVSPGDVTVNAQGSYSGVVAGVTYDFTVTCTDSAGAALAHCGPTTNDATATVSWSGDLSIPDYTATVTRSGNWSVTGLQSGVATFSGTGTFDYSSQFTSTFSNEKASASYTYDASYKSVTYNATSHVVTGGTITYAITGSAAASSTNGSANGNFTMNAVVTFDGTGGATISLDGTHNYTVTASGVVVKI